MYDLSTICSLCLTDIKHLLGKDASNRNNNKEILFVLPELIILEPESFMRICAQCLSTINQFYNFKAMCLKNNATLWSNVNKYKYNDIEGEQQAEITTSSEAVASNENFDYSFVKFKNREISEDESDVQELFGSLKLMDSILISSNEDLSAQNIEHNSKNQIKSVNNKQNQNGTRNVKCIVCNKEFKQKNHLTLHMKIHNNIKAFHCSVCSKKFIKKIDLKCHMKVHRDTKRFECTVCNEKFKYRVALSKHKKLHKAYDREFECLVCSKRFVEKGYFKIHMKIHTKTKNYECTVCNKRFLQKNHLNTHMRRHTGIKDFECSICRKQFIQRIALKLHINKHSCIKNFHCSLCNKTILREDHFNSHMRAKHNVIK